eukprot:TRINITY_DN2606_c0_g1_i2.p1 TRINITY_DN2606_c0_g1~~TRINITY_DN2606_c0_g1_i2.p1  ORF type:complete len:125 (-),score=19.59 TRINITY_DN2606_c0_g1_i2:176-499(-)
MSLARATRPGFASLFAGRSRSYVRSGLHREDLLNAELPEMMETLSRLPHAVKEEREIRIRRAIELDLKGEELPEAEWTKEDVDSVSYLEPFLTEVLQENAERASFRA